MDSDGSLQYGNDMKAYVIQPLVVVLKPHMGDIILKFLHRKQVHPWVSLD